MNVYFQLYSARKTPIRESLRLIAEAGYAGVEAYDDNMADAHALKLMLDEFNLTLPSMHISLDRLRACPEACFTMAEQFECQHIVCPYLADDERPADAHAWQHLGEELERIAGRWESLGCTFAWHNHDFEFRELPDGSSPLAHLLDASPSTRWEVDVAWIVRAGVQALPWIRQYKERISAVHLKDIASAGENRDEDGWADLGYGVLDWHEVMPVLLSSGASLYITEHDNPSDLKRFATRSLITASALLT